MAPSLHPMRLRAGAWLSCLALAALVACGGGEEESVVAEVGDEQFTVEEVAEFMVENGSGANIEAVREAIDQMIDFELVQQRARADHQLTATESLQVKEWEEVLLINQFRQDVVWESVEIDSAELRDWYEENVGEEVRARHVLIRVPRNASEEEKAEARRKADSLRQAIVGAGTDFEEVAREHSEDPGSAPRGGDLGWVRQGQMVEAFDEAAFGTPEGEVSPVVETQFGFHVIEVTGKRKRSFEEMREEIAQEVAGPRRTEVEQAYVTRLMETSGVEFFEENIDALIAMMDEQRAPSEEQERLRLATFREGKITLGEIWELYQALPPANRQAIDRLDQEGMIRALSTIVQQRLLLARAREAEVELDSSRQSALDERVGALYAQAHLREAARGQLEVTDSLARAYYREHREFYQDQSYEEVADQIKDVLRTQKMQALSGPEAQQRLVESVADSQAQRMEVVRYEEHYEQVLPVVREKYEETGRQPAQPQGGPEPGTAPRPAPEPAPRPEGTGERTDATS